MPQVTQKVPEATEQMMHTFDQTLLKYLKASRENRPNRGGRNYKLQVTTGKLVSEEEVLEPEKKQ